MIQRPYFLVYDGTESLPLPNQSDDPVNTRFVPQGTANARTVWDSNQNPYTIGDGTVRPHAGKDIIWSSEGWTFRGLSINALTGTQKLTTNNQSANFVNAPALADQATLDFSPYNTLMLSLVFSSFTGGTSPAIVFELDSQDDAGTPNVYPLFVSSSITAASKNLIVVSRDAVFAQATSAPSTTIANATAFSVASGWNLIVVPLPFLPQGVFKWTVTGAPTAASWTAILYGNNL
jgi:hypothetical protein